MYAVAVGHPRLSTEGEWMAAILACGPGSYRADADRDARLRATGHTVLRLRDHEVDEWPRVSSPP